MVFTNQVNVERHLEISSNLYMWHVQGVTCRKFSIFTFHYKSLVHFKCYILIQTASQSNIWLQRYDRFFDAQKQYNTLSSGLKYRKFVWFNFIKFWQNWLSIIFMCLILCKWQFWQPIPFWIYYYNFFTTIKSSIVWLGSCVIDFMVWFWMSRF